MAAQDIKTLTRRFMEDVFEKKDFQAIDKYLAKDFVDHTPPPGTSPDLAGAKEGIRQLYAAFPDSTFPIESMIAEGDTVVIRSTWRGTHRGEMGGIPPTGKRVNVPAVDIVRFENGKQVEHWGFIDQQAMMTQLGLGPETQFGQAASGAGKLYARVSIIQGKPEQIDETIRAVKEQIIPSAQQIRGFKGITNLADRKSGKTMAITLWESEEALRASEEEGSRLRAQAASRAGATAPPIVERYEVIQQVGPASAKEPVVSGTDRARR